MNRWKAGPTRHGLLRSMLTAVLVFAMTLGFSAFVAPAAQAATFTPTNINITTSPDPIVVTQYWGEEILINFEGCIPASANGGDTFTLTLPNVLSGWPPATTINDNTGTAVFNVTVSNTTPAVATFNLTPYGANLTNACFFATFNATSGDTPGGVYDTTIKVNSTVVATPQITINQGTYEVPTEPDKWGGFASPDNCNTITADCIDWTLVTPGGNNGIIHIVDTASPNWEFDCSWQMESTIRTVIDVHNATENYLNSAQTAAYVSNLSCTPGQITFDLNTSSLAANQFMWITMKANAKVASIDGGVKYENHATMTIKNTDYTPGSSFSSAYIGGGVTGDGIKIVKRDEVGNDANTAAAAVNLPTGSTGLVFTVRNIGTTDLTNVNVSDVVDSGSGTVSNLTCNFSEAAGGAPTSGTTWSGPFTPGSSFTCTADLTGVAGPHADTAKVTATGNGPVSDDDPYNATAPVAAKKVSIGDYVWLDTDRDGVQDGTEKPVADVTVTLKDKNGNVVGTTTTDAAGFYSFAGLDVSTDYTLTFTTPTGYSITLQDKGGDDAKDSDANGAGVISLTTQATAGTNSLSSPDMPTFDVGMVQYNLVLKKTLDTAGPFVPGQDVTYTLTPSNDGLANALPGWTVTDLLPSGMTLKSMSGTGYTCVGNVCTANAGLAAGATAGAITVVATVNAGATGVQKNVAYVAPSGTDVTETNPLGTPPTTGTNTVTSSTDNDAEAQLSIASVSIGDYVWWDTNRDGFQSDGEKPVEKVTVKLFDNSGNLVATTTTDVDGYYYFKDLAPGTKYTVQFVAPTDASFTTQDATPTADKVDSDANVTDGKVAITTPTTGSNLTGHGLTDDPTIDAGLVKFNLVLKKSLVTVGPFVPGQDVSFKLTPSNDGPVDALAGWSVTDVLPVGLTLKSMSGTGYDCVGSVCTAQAGLAAGAAGAPITVVATIGSSFTGTAKNVAYVAPAGSDVVETNPLGTPPTTVTDTVGSPTDNDAEASLTVDVVSIGDYVWWDVNRDGQQGAGEDPVPGVTVKLFDAMGVLVDSTTTDGAGYYNFAGLLPGTDYTVQFVKPGDTSFTTRNVTGSDDVDSDASLVDGTVSVKTPSGGSNLTGPGLADDPSIDAGLVKYNLVLAKSLDTAGPWVAGQTVSFTLTPSNQGPVDALAGWSVTDVMSSNLTLVSMTGGAAYDCAANVCTAKAGLAAGASAPAITVTAKVGSAFGQMRNVAYVSPAGSDVVETVPLDPTLPGSGTDTTKTPTDNDAQAVLDLKPVSIGDFVWWDVDRDGQQGAGEDAVPGVTVKLYDADGVFITSTVTDGAGHYFFDGLQPSTDYIVEFVAPAQAGFTTPMTGAAATDSDADVVTGRVLVTSPAQGSNGSVLPDDPTIDAGLIKYNLVLAKSLDTAAPFYFGQSVSFTLTPRNEGPVNALAGWSVTDVLPAGLTLSSMTGSGYTCVGNVCVSDSPLAAGQAGNPITVVATISATATGVLHNVAYVAPDGGDFTETVPLGTPPTTGDDTSKSVTDNDAQASLTLSPVSIGDYVWFDVNRDGAQGDSNAAVGGVTVKLYDAKGALVDTTATDGAGKYAFTGLVPGAAYTVEFVKPTGMSFTTQNSAGDAADSDADVVTGRVSVTAPRSGSNSADNPDDPTIDAGLVKYNLTLVKKLVTAGPFYSGQTVSFTLTPHNQGPVDALAGWSVTDVLPAGLTLQSMTGGAGYACTGNTCVADAALAAGADGAPITVVATISKSFTGTAKNVAYVDKAGSDVDETVPLGDPVPTTDTNTVDSVTDNDDEASLTVVAPVKVGDYVWIDYNRDGLQDGSDIPVQGATLVLTLPDGSPAVDIYGNKVGSLTTDASGWYLFTELPAGTYVVTVDPSTAPALVGYVPTIAGAGAGDVDSSTGSATSVALAAGQQDLTLDFGFVAPKVSVGDYVWVDANHNGVQDKGELPLEGVMLTLTGPDGQPVNDVTGQPVGPTYTDAQGGYLFENLPVLPEGQHYTVTLDPSTVPAGLIPTREGKGTPATDSSTGTAESGDLLVDGDHDLTLDFGFWNPAPAIQIVKKDKAGNDANSWATGVKITKDQTTLVFTVTNVGNEDLENITISDQVIQGGTVKGLSCKFPDGTTGTTWAGPFTIGDSFKCTATLTKVTSKHKDIATATGTGVDSGTSVTDTDPYHAKPDNGVLPEHGGPGNLPNTGSPVAPWMLGTATAAILAGLLLLIAGRRRRHNN